jgi:endonuclease YncB( thermonuclease family)
MRGAKNDRNIWGSCVMVKLSFILPIALLIASCQNFSLSTLRACTVVGGSVHDGDTIRVDCGVEQLRIRFACVDAPELDQPGGILSRDYLRSLLNGANNQVSINPVHVDRFGRTVAEVYVNGQLVQLQQSKHGMVWAWDRFKGNCSRWDEVERAFNQAQREGRGIFASGNPLPPWEWRRSKNNYSVTARGMVGRRPVGSRA